MNYDSFQSRIGIFIIAYYLLIFTQIGGACSLGSPVSSYPKYLQFERFNYNLINNQVIIDRLSGSHTYNHILNKGSFYLKVNSALSLAAQNDTLLYSNVIQELRKYTDTIIDRAKLPISFKMKIVNDLKESLGSGDKCSSELSNLVGWLQGNLFLSPPSELRSWDPGSSFDYWGQFTVDHNLYKKYLTMHDNGRDINLSNYQNFLSGLISMLGIYNPFQEKYEPGRVSKVWVFGPAQPGYKKGYCPKELLNNGICLAVAS